MLFTHVRLRDKSLTVPLVFDSSFSSHLPLTTSLFPKPVSPRRDDDSDKVTPKHPVHSSTRNGFFLHFSSCVKSVLIPHQFKHKVFLNRPMSYLVMSYPFSSNLVNPLCRSSFRLNCIRIMVGWWRLNFPSL